MQIIDNINKTVKDDLQAGIHKGSKMSVAAACFSIYAYQELKKQLDSIDELRFIFTSPTFVTEKASKAQREFYIPRISRECSLYGTEFEVIPYHILFILTCDGKAQAWIGYKEAAASGSNAFKVSRYYHTDWMPEDELHLSIDGLNMDAIYESLVRQIAGDKLQQFCPAHGN